MKADRHAKISVQFENPVVFGDLMHPQGSLTTAPGEIRRTRRIPDLKWIKLFHFLFYFLWNCPGSRIKVFLTPSSRREAIQCLNCSSRGCAAEWHRGGCEAVLSEEKDGTMALSFWKWELLSLSILCCWWRVICGCCVGKRKGSVGMKAKVSFIFVLQVLFLSYILQN